MTTGQIILVIFLTVIGAIGFIGSIFEDDRYDRGGGWSTMLFMVFLFSIAMVIMLTIANNKIPTNPPTCNESQFEKIDGEIYRKIK